MPRHGFLHAQINNVFWRSRLEVNKTSADVDLERDTLVSRETSSSILIDAILAAWLS